MPKNLITQHRAGTHEVNDMSDRENGQDTKQWEQDTEFRDKLELHFREVRDIAKAQVTLAESQRNLIESQQIMTTELKNVNTNLEYIGDGLNAGFDLAKNLLRLFGKIIIGGVVVIVCMALMILYITQTDISGGGVTITHGASNK